MSFWSFEHVKSQAIKQVPFDFISVILFFVDIKNLNNQRFAFGFRSSVNSCSLPTKWQINILNHHKNQLKSGLRFFQLMKFKCQLFM